MSAKERSELFQGIQQCADHRLAEMEREYNTLRQFPSLQAETIAKHYTACAGIAVHLLALIKSRKYTQDHKNINATIAKCVEQIKQEHRQDFGIELEWRNEMASES